jgi:hypothetical protein
MSIQDKIQTLLNNGYQFNFSKYIGDAFTLAGKNVGGFIGYTLLYLIISSAMSNIPYLGQVGSTLISYPLMVGFYIIASRIQKNEVYEFGNFFDGFQRFKDLAILSILISLVSLAAALPILAVVGFGIFELIGNDDPTAIIAIFENVNWGLFALTTIPLIYVTIAYAWSVFFVYFHNMQPWEAMEASRKLITKRWFTFFGFNFVLGLIVLVGLLAFIVGIFYAIPVIVIAGYLSFEDIVGIGKENAEDDIFDHFIQED